MSARKRRYGRALVVGLGLTISALTPPPPATAEGGADAIVDLPVGFTVTNTNTSRVPCPPPDGESYVIRGHLVGPRRALYGSDAPPVTLYQPGFSFTQAYWHLTAVPGYDYATKMAERGHTSIVYDLLGYGASDRPSRGERTCWGSDADHAHQIVAHLRAGDYELTGAQAVDFDRVVLASHYSAGLAAQPEAYSYQDIDGLLVTSWAPQHFTEAHLQVAGEGLVDCSVGSGGTRGGYVFVPRDEERFRQLFFHAADPSVVDAVAAARSPVPCGQPQSAVQANVMNGRALREVTVPVLLAFGLEDHAFVQPEAAQSARAQYCAACDVRVELLEATGNALVLEPSAPRFRAVVHEWLCDHALAEAAACNRRVPIVA